MKIKELIESLTPYPEAEAFIEYYDSGSGERELAELDRISIVLDKDGAQVSVTLET